MAFRNPFVIVLAVVVAVTILITTNFGAGTTVIYDCRLSEFHPDFPPSVREECRKLIKEQTKKITT
jgi:hypothetical protein